MSTTVTLLRFSAGKFGRYKGDALIEFKKRKAMSPTNESPHSKTKTYQSLQRRQEGLYLAQEQEWTSNDPSTTCVFPCSLRHSLSRIERPLSGIPEHCQELLLLESCFKTGEMESDLSNQCFLSAHWYLFESKVRPLLLRIRTLLRLGFSCCRVCRGQVDPFSCLAQTPAHKHLDLPRVSEFPSLVKKNFGVSRHSPVNVPFRCKKSTTLTIM